MARSLHVGRLAVWPSGRDEVDNENAANDFGYSSDVDREPTIRRERGRSRPIRALSIFTIGAKDTCANQNLLWPPRVSPFSKKDVKQSIRTDRAQPQRMRKSSGNDGSWEDKMLKGMLMALAVLAGATVSHANDKVSLVLEWRLQGAHAPFILAKKRG